MDRQIGASVVLVASEGVKSIGRIIERLGAQSEANRLEVIIAADPEFVGELADIDLGVFADLRVVSADMATSARARITGIYAARGPVVALVEDHAFPMRDDWARRVIEFANSRHTGLGPVMRNANPKTATSWASLVIEYGPWLDAPSRFEVPFIPGHNSLYKRDGLLALGDDLADLLEAEWLLQKALGMKGHTFCLDPDLEIEHLNFSKPSLALRLHFLSGRMFAASRRLSWNMGYRALYIVGVPGIIVLRIARATRHFLRSPNARPHTIRALPMTAASLIASGCGEGLGYAFGDGGHRSAHARLEFRRWKNLLDDEVELAFEHRQ